MTIASQRTWKTGPQIRVLSREAADGGKPLRIPVVIQHRTSNGTIVYRWKEQYDFGAGDFSEEFSDRGECIRDAASIKE